MKGGEQDGMQETQTERTKKEIAKGCNDCLCWLKHCQAECCKRFYVDKRVVKLVKGNYKIRINLTNDLLKYYLLHGCYYGQGCLNIPAHKFIIVEKEGELIFIRKCDWLNEDNQCQNYEKRPSVCKELDETKKDQPPNMRITPNCLANFK